MTKKGKKFFRVNYQPADNEHISPGIYVDNAIDEISLVRTNQDKDLNNFNFTNRTSNTLNTHAVIGNQVITKSYVDQFLQQNGRTSRDVGSDFYNEINDLVKNNHDNIFIVK